MGSCSGSAPSILATELLNAPRSFSFAKAVELIQQMSSKDNPFLFRANPTFGFPSSDIYSIKKSSDDVFEVIVNFMGLYGPSSPLPDYFTQEIIDEQVELDTEALTTFYLHSISELIAYQEGRLDIGSVRKRFKDDSIKIKSKQVNKIVLTHKQVEGLRNKVSADELLSATHFESLINQQSYLEVNLPRCANQRDFLDLFNHQLITLYLEATRKYHPYFSADISKDYNRSILLSLMGVPAVTDRSISLINWNKLLRFAGLLTMKQGASESMKKVIAGYFDFNLSQIEIEEYVLRQVAIDHSQLNSLGRVNNKLGESFLCGCSVPDRSSKFRIHLMDLTIEDFLSFLPLSNGADTERKYNELIAIIDFLKSPEQLSDIALHIRPGQPLQMRLQSGQPAILGFTSWLNPSESQSCHVVI